MTLAPGTRLGPYEVVAPLGAGGMGEVYRARDPRLGRDVAVKSLPDAFAGDPERLARFEREARLLASLSHPNIAGIHGLELVEGHRYLVLEFVEGETLAQRLARGPLAIAEAVDIARQIASGVEAAHEAGVVHRDLKPGNVMLKADGSVKVLDFGLAKGNAAHAASGSDPQLSASPTLTYAATDAGVILGTAAYMSPEQARGRAVDRRTDIWSFGCVLYECLTGRQVFHGETVSDMVARILEREPDWSALPATPSWLRRLLSRCLTKDVRQRLQSIGEARIALERGGEDEPASAPAPASRPAWLAWAPWVLVLALGAFTVTRAFAPAAPEAERRLQLGYPAGQSNPWYAAPMLSPDGRRVALVTMDSTGITHVWTRSLGEPDFRLVNGTNGAQSVFWSPDSRALGFMARGAIWRVSIDQGAVQKVVDGIAQARGAHWGANGRILYTPGANEPIWSVPADGGTPVQLTRLDTTLVDVSHRYPVWLPDGKHFLFALWSNNARVLAEAGGIYVASTGGGAPRRVSNDIGQFFLMPHGALMVVRNGGLVAVPFDVRALRVGAAATSIAPRIDFNPSAGAVPASVSATGDIAYAQPAELPPTDLAWIDRGGRRNEPLGIRSGFLTVRLSPDASHVAAEVLDATGLSQVWTADLARRTSSRLSRGQNDSYEPVWSSDGTRILFGNRDSGTDDLYIQLAAGTRPKEKVFAAADQDAVPEGWSSDGRYLLFTGIPRAASRNRERQLWVKDLARDSTWALLAGDDDQYGGRLSPDGHWLAYVSEESGRSEVYVRSFPDLERKWQASTAGGRLPHWRADSRELVYAGGNASEITLWAVSLAPSASGLTIGDPQRLFTAPPDVVDLDCARDHSRFLALIQPAAQDRPMMNLVTGWRPGRRS